MTKSITLCADDYALHPAVDEAVCRLAEQDRLHATSAMTTSPRWSEAAARLRPLRNTLAVGLHFNLTEGHEGTVEVASLPQLLARAYTHRLAPKAMAEALHLQLDRFESEMRTPPDFIDGHQHVHQFPGIRQALDAVLHQRYGQRRPWVRSTWPAGQLWRDAKASVIALLGGWQLHRQLQAQGWPHNHGFAGVYGFDAATPEAYGERMAQWMAQVQDGSLIMCHPATTPVEGDAIGVQRAVEYRYLSSPAFGDLLAREQVQLQRWARE